MKILVINSGSSSIKYKLFNMPKDEVITEGSIERIGERGSRIKDHPQGLRLILSELEGIQALGHRVVHGGERFKEPVLIDKAVINKIRQCYRLAPLHNPANLSGILASWKFLPGVPQVAVFDTSFYQTLSAYSYLYAFPYKYYTRYGIRRYGFHGTSHEFIAQEASRRLKRPLNSLRLITCHLGNGCSITAVERGKAIDTSMGFTPLEGLVMGTRCGDIDAAIIPYLMKRDRLSPQRLEDILNKQSGLKGLSGISNDMRRIKMAAKKGNRRAQLALDVFIYRLKKYIGAYIAVMQGVDALVFTAGIAENNPDIIKSISRGLFSFLKKKPKVLILHTNEELMIARKTYRLLKRNSLID